MKKILFAALVILLCAILVGISLWWVSPKVFLKNALSEQIERIEVFNGSTGNSFTVTDAENIAYIVSNIQEVEMRKEGISSGEDGYRFHLTFYDRAGNKLDSFIINSDDTIRCDPFFYRSEKAALCVDFLEAVENESTS